MCWEGLRPSLAALKLLALRAAVQCSARALGAGSQVRGSGEWGVGVLETCRRRTVQGGGRACFSEALFLPLFLHQVPEGGP